MNRLNIILRQLVEEQGITILAQSRLKGLILDMITSAEKRYINVFKKAVDDQLGAKLIAMQSDDPSLRTIKINTLKEKFKNENGFDETAYYIVDCFVHSLGWESLESAIVLPFKEIKIGNQIWADRNLDVSHFRNGDPIPEAKTNQEWRKAGKMKQPACCFLYNDPENGKKYGKLYNWYAINDPRGISLEGWNVASDQDWKELEGCVDTKFGIGDNEWDIGNNSFEFPIGRGFDAGIKLKCANLSYNNATNDHKFTALPGGDRSPKGVFHHSEDHGFWWSSTEYSSTFAWRRYLYYFEDGIIRSRISKNFGYSVRCIKVNIKTR